MSLAWLIVSLGLFGAGAWVLGMRARGAAWLLGSLGGLLAVLCSAWVVADRFTGRGIEESVIYHLAFGLQGAGFREYLGLMGLAVGLLFVSLGYGFLVAWLSRRQPVALPASAGWLALPLLVLGWGVNPAVSDLVAVGRQVASADPRMPLPDFYQEPREVQHLAPDGQPRNLLVIYAESLEQGYFDETRFPGLMPRLKARQDEALRFTSIHQLPGMWWTIGGMVGSQCGVPLTISPGDEITADAYLPGATCIGDILADQGYRLAYIGGANGRFAGKASFYWTHGFDGVTGRDELAETLDDPSYRNAWGMYDDVTLPAVAQRFDALAEGDEPFALVTLTLDTHHPEGHVSAECRDRPYRDGSNPILNAAHCSDRLIDELIDHVMASPHAEETLVVLLSDHIAMKNTASDLLEAKPRHNLFWLFGEGVPAGESDRPASQLDVGPTLLEAMDLEVPALGLGRSLFREAPTFIESHEPSDEALRELFPRLSGLWAHASVKGGVSVDTQHRRAGMGKRYLEYPVLAWLGEDLEVEEMVQAPEIAAEIADRMQDMPYLWIDDCSRNAPEHGLGDGMTCVLWGGGPDAPGAVLPVTSRVAHVTAERLERSEAEPGERVASLVERLPRLVAGGRMLINGEPVDALPARAPGDAAMVRLQASPDPGRVFVRWEGLSGVARHQPELRLPWHESLDVEPVFDQGAEAESPVLAYRSAWAGVASPGRGKVAERLAPPDSAQSVVRLALWLDGVGSIDLRSYGGFAMSRPEGFIRIDDEPVLGDGRGLGLVVLDGNGEVRHAQHYDTYASEAQSEEMVQALRDVDADEFVLVASMDEFTSSLTPALLRELQALGFQIAGE